MTTTRAMKPKERVLAKYPYAKCVYRHCAYMIEIGNGDYLADDGHSEARAWEFAAAKLNDTARNL